MASLTPAEIVVSIKKYTGLTAQELIPRIVMFGTTPKDALIVTTEMLKTAYEYGRNTALAENIAKDAITAAKNVTE